MATSRSYGERCGIARALDVIGERWAVLIVRELLLGPKRFTDLRDGLPGVSHNVLSHRLRELQDAGIVERRRLSPPVSVAVWALTERGCALEPVLVALGRWGAATPAPPPEVGMSLDAHVVALRTLFDPALAAGIRARVQLQLAGQSFLAEVSGKRLDLARGQMRDPDVTLRTTPAVLLALVRGRRTLQDGLRTGDVELDGEKATAESFLTMFPQPA